MGLFKAFNLEQHELAEVLVEKGKKKPEQQGLADVLIEKNTVPVATKMLRNAWTQSGQLQLLFVIAAIAVAWSGPLKLALLMTLIIQAGQTIFFLYEQLANPFGVDDALRAPTNPRIGAVLALNIVLTGVQYYGWRMAQSGELGVLVVH